MSPEQLKAEPLDGRADLFALGVVLFEALAGERPYEGAHDPATIMRTLNGDHPSLKSLAPEAPKGLCDLIEQLIEPDREKRPATATALIEALADFAPSPRIRLDLGRLVRRLSAEIQQKKAERGSGRISAKTDVLPEEGSGSIPDAASAEPSSSVQTPWSRSPERQDAALEDTAAIVSPLTPTPPAPVEPRVPPVAAATASLSTDPVHLVRPPAAGGAARRAGAPQHELLRRASSEPVIGRTPAVGAERKGRRSRRAIAVLVGGFMLIVGGTIAFAVVFWPSSESPQTPSPTTTQPKPQPPAKARAVAEPQDEVPAAKAQPKPVPASAIQSAAEQPPTTAAPVDPAPRPKPKVAPEPQAKPKTKPPSKATTKPRRAKPKSGPKKPARSEPSTPEPVARTPAQLTITVFPWGNIWIDGKPWGPAPLTNELFRAGTYKISVGQDSPTKTRSVELKPGQRRTVSFDLSE